MQYNNKRTQLNTLVKICCEESTILIEHGIIAANLDIKHTTIEKEHGIIPYFDLEN